MYRTTRYSEQIFINGQMDLQISAALCADLRGVHIWRENCLPFVLPLLGSGGPTMITSALVLLQGDPSLVVRACTRSVSVLFKPLFMHSVALPLPSHLKVHALRSFARGIQLHLSRCVATCSASFISASTQLRPYTFDYIERTDGQSQACYPN